MVLQSAITEASSLRACSCRSTDSTTMTQQSQVTTPLAPLLPFPVFSNPKSRTRVQSAYHNRTRPNHSQLVSFPHIGIEIAQQLCHFLAISLCSPTSRRIIGYSALVPRAVRRRLDSLSLQVFSAEALSCLPRTPLLQAEVIQKWGRTKMSVMRPVRASAHRCCW